MRGKSMGCWLTSVTLAFTFVQARQPATAAELEGAIDRPIVLTQIRAGAAVEAQPGCGEAMLRCDYADGSRLVRLDPGGEVHVLSEGFDSACEPDVSFDGSRILFAARKQAGEKWNIWEMDADGSNPRQITHDAGNCRTPAYQSTLYTIISTEPWFQIMFTSDVAGEMNEVGSRPSRSVYSCRLDGSELRRLTMNPSDDLDPFLMADGRVLLGVWQRMDLRRGLNGRIALFGVNTDGTDYALYNAQPGSRIKHMPCETSAGLVVFVEADAVGWDGAGQLACVEPRRHYYSRRPITRAEEGWLYHSPAPTGDGLVLVSRRPADGRATHGLIRLDPATGQATAIFDDPEYHDLDAKVIATRTTPDGRSSSVNEEITSGILYCLDAYNTDPDIMQYMRPGLIKRLRVIEGVPVSTDNTEIYLSEDDRVGLSGPGATRNGLVPVLQKRLLGDIPIEADGSFQIEVPPDVPIQLQTVDENGMAIRSCGWIWVKHREWRGCIGCHEDPELTPENRLVDAVTRPAVQLMLPPERRRTVDFRRDVMPIITENCATSGCHGDETSPLDLRDEPAGRFNRAYVNLLAGSVDPDGMEPVRGKYIEPGRARTSMLIWRLYGRSTARAWDAEERTEMKFPPMPAHPENQPLTEAQKQTLIEWIDLGAHWDGVPGEDSVTAMTTDKQD